MTSKLLLVSVLMLLTIGCETYRQKQPEKKPSPFTQGTAPYRSANLQRRLLEPLGRSLGFGEGIGWHTFRHSYSSLLRANGTDIKVQQELLRHADIRTTINIYTQAPSDQKREAHRNVVQMVLKGAAVSAMA